MTDETMDRFEKWLQERRDWAGENNRYDYGCGLIDALAKFRALRAESACEDNGLVPKGDKS